MFFCGYPSTNLPLSIITDQLVHYVLIAMESASFEEWEPEDETDNFDHSSP